MSFLWHGLTEQGAQVPVQVDAQGRVIAVDGTPGVSNWERTGTTLSPAVSGDDVDLGTGDISATTGTFGSATFASDVKIGGTLPSTPNITLNANGSAKFNARIQCGTNGDTYGAICENSSVAALWQSAITAQNYAAGGTVFAGLAHDFNATAAKVTSWIKEDGSATFAGNVTAANITFRSADPAFYVPNERSQSYDGTTDTYTGPELNLLEEIVRLEALVKHLYDVLRQNPPAGWAVWDGDTDLIKSRGRRPHR